MLFYDCATAPSPRRVRIFAAEMGIELPTHQVDLRAGEHLGEAFRKLNPECTVPLLVLDDGTAIAETVAICRYLEAAYPDGPRLFGDGAAARGLVEMWNRRMELEGIQAVVEGFRNGSPGFRDRALAGPRPVAQIPELADRGRRRFGWFLDDLDVRLGTAEHVAGNAFSIADITALVAVEFGGRALKMPVGAERSNLQRWHERVRERESTA